MLLILKSGKKKHLEVDDKFAKDMIKVHEGLRLDKYMDSRGFPTIGYGHLIQMRHETASPNRRQMSYLIRTMIIIRMLGNEEPG